MKPGDAVDGGDRDSVDERDGAPSSCGYDDSVDAGGSSTAPVRPDGVSFNGTLIDYGSSNRCPALQQTAPYILPLSRGNQPLPPPLGGGTIRDGRYELVLVEVNNLSNTGAATAYYRRTIEFGGCGSNWVLTTLTRVEGENDTYLQFTDRASLTTDLSTLTAHYDDPCWVNPGNITYRYEATSDTVVMWFEPAGTLLTYLRVR